MPKNNTTLFIVEDDKVFCEMVADFVRTRFKSLRVVTFPNGEEALKAIDQKPAIVLLDYFLHNKNPDAMNGLEVLGEWKKIDPSAHIIMISAQEDLEVAANIIKFGAYDYIIKNEAAMYRLENILVHLNYHLMVDKKILMNKFIMVLMSALIFILLILFVFTLT